MTIEQIQPLLELDPWPIKDCIRRVGGVRYLVPYTTHWANWHDDDAIRHHGMRIGLMSAEALREGIRGLCALHAWDTQATAKGYESRKPTKTHFDPIEQFETARDYGGLL